MSQRLRRISPRIHVNSVLILELSDAGFARMRPPKWAYSRSALEFAGRCPCSLRN
jgi:hypothetical protein